MHNIDIKTLSIESLAALRDDVNKLLSEKVAAHQRELELEMARIGALSSAEIPARAKAKPKYRKGDLTWGGRGSQPAWVKAHLDGGGTLDDLRA